MIKDSNLHSGHWARIRDKILKNNISSLTEIEALEALLQFVFVRGDTNEMACRLIKKFGSFSNVMQASIEDLIMVDGFGKTSAEKLVMMPKLLEFFNLCEAKREVSEKLVTTADCAKIANRYLSGLRTERLIMFCLNDAGFVNKVVILAEGDESGAKIDIKDLIVIAQKHNAKSVVFAHNHPNGSVKPSMIDINFTKRAYNILRLSGIPLYDHIIIAKGEYFSFAYFGLIIQFSNEFKNNFGEK